MSTLLACTSLQLALSRLLAAADAGLVRPPACSVARAGTGWTAELPFAAASPAAFAALEGAMMRRGGGAATLAAQAGLPCGTVLTLWRGSDGGSGVHAACSPAFPELCCVGALQPPATCGRNCTGCVVAADPVGWNDNDLRWLRSLTNLELL
eukprot:203524-Chlamydomonas_euryale.AAC.1